MCTKAVTKRRTAKCLHSVHVILTPGPRNRNTYTLSQDSTRKQYVCYKLSWVNIWHSYGTSNMR